MSFIRPIALAGLCAALAVLVAGCGSSSSQTTASRSSSTAAAPATPGAPSNRAAFAWLHPGSAPAGWSAARLPDHAVLAYPSSWQRVHSDPQAVSAAVMDQRTDLVVDYLNVTPRQGAETLQNWTAFRPDHNKDEGDSQIQVLAAARGLRFRDGPGSCVIDRYRTPRTSYQEIACLVQGPRGANVIVAAALAPRWAQDAATLERAVSAFVA